MWSAAYAKRLVKLTIMDAIGPCRSVVQGLVKPQGNTSYWATHSRYLKAMRTKSTLQNDTFFSHLSHDLVRATEYLWNELQALVVILLFMAYSETISVCNDFSGSRFDDEVCMVSTYLGRYKYMQPT